MSGRHSAERSKWHSRPWWAAVGSIASVLAIPVSVGIYFISTMDGARPPGATKSSWPNESHLGSPSAPPADEILLTDLADRATWTSAAGKIPFGDNKNRGIAKLAKERLEDGVTGFGILTQPNWEANGFIRGCFNLPRAIRDRDRFQAGAGFPAWVNETGSVHFEVYVRDRDGGLVRIADELDTRSDGEIRQIDVRLDGFATSSTICLHVSGRATGEDSAFWVRPRLSRPR